MTEFVDRKFGIRIDLAALLQERYIRQGITQKDYVNGLLERELVESVRRDHEADQARNRREATKVEAPVKSLGQIAGDVSKVVTTLEKTLPDRLAGVGERLTVQFKEAIAALDFRQHLAAQKTAAEKHTEDLKVHLTTGWAGVEKGAANRHSEVLGCLDDHRKLMLLTKSQKRRLVLVTIASLIGFAAAFCFLFSASAPVRWTMVRAMGEKTERDAATTLAGSGVRYNGMLLAETAALLRDPIFAKDYGSCVERAKRTTSVATSCKLYMTALDTQP